MPTSIKRIHLKKDKSFGCGNIYVVFVCSVKSFYMHVFLRVHIRPCSLRV